MRLHLKALVVIPCLGAACGRAASGRTDTLPRTATAVAAVGAAPATSTPTVAPAGSPDTAHQPAVFDSVLATVHAGQTTCYRLARWFVVEQTDGETGSDVLVRRHDADAASDPACALDSLAGDFVSRNDSTGYFGGIHGRWVFLGDSDGPDGGYFVHDLSTGRITTHVDGEDLVRWRDSVTVEIWVRQDTVAHARCPDVPPAMLAGVESLMAVDLRSATQTPLGASRCAAWD